MGMFDWLKYQEEEYQTKDTPAQSLDNYKIEQDQTSGHWHLWHEDYDAEWKEDADRFSGGYIKHFNQRWVCCDEFDGEIRFYREDKNNGGYYNNRWIEYKALFMNGQMLKIKEVFDEPLTKWYKQGIEDKGIK